MKRPLLVALPALIVLACTLPADAERVRLKRNITYAHHGGVDLQLDAYLPREGGPFPGILVVHGGSWKMGSKEQLALHAYLLAKKGYAVFAINYRLAPRHKWPAQIHDCKAAVRWIRQHAGSYRVNPDRLGAFGYSAGGQLVTLLGVTDERAGLEGPAAKGSPSTRVQAVCAGGAPVDFEIFPDETPDLAYWLGGTPGEVPEAYRTASPSAFLSADDPPVLFFHGRKDTLVPVQWLLPTVKSMERTGIEVELKIMPRRGHIGSMLTREPVEWAGEFFDEHLKRADITAP